MKVQNGQEVFDLVLSSDELFVIHEALLERPFKVAAPLINRINQQLAAQRPPPPKREDLPELPEGADYQRHQNGMPRPS